jgi:hypothetical protein
LVLVSLLFGPSNPWQPKWSEIQFGRSWMAIAIGDIVMKTPSPYVDVVRKLNQSCQINENYEKRIEKVNSFQLSDYQKSQLFLYAQYCPKSI